MMGGGNPSQSAPSNSEGSWSESAGSILNLSHYKGGIGSGRVCYCGLTTMVRRSKTTANHGRSFYDCPKYKSKNGDHCNYFSWFHNGAKDNGTGTATEHVTETATEVATERGSRVAKSEHQE